MSEYKYKTLADDPLSKFNDQDDDDITPPTEKENTNPTIESAWKKVFYFEHGYYPKDLKDGIRFLGEMPSYDEFMESRIPGFSGPKPPSYKNTPIFETVDKNTIRILDPNVSIQHREAAFKDIPMTEYAALKKSSKWWFNDSNILVTEQALHMMILHNVTPIMVINTLYEEVPKMVDCEIPIHEYSRMDFFSVYIDSKNNLLNVIRHKYYEPNTEVDVASLARSLYRNLNADNMDEPAYPINECFNIVHNLQENTEPKYLIEAVNNYIRQIDNEELLTEAKKKQKSNKGYNPLEEIMPHIWEGSWRYDSINDKYVLTSGGHGKLAYDRMLQAGYFEPSDFKPEDNGVLVGKVPNHPEKSRQEITHTFFPLDWKEDDIKNALRSILTITDKEEIVKKVNDVNILIRYDSDEGKVTQAYPTKNQK